MEVLFFLLWIPLCAIAGQIAHSKGRSGFGFFMLAFILSPLIGILCAAFASKDERELDFRRLTRGDSKRCPHCAEIIRIQADVCRYCGRDITPLN